jgi:hypothetical protein
LKSAPNIFQEKDSRPLISRRSMEGVGSFFMRDPYCSTT